MNYNSGGNRNKRYFDNSGDGGPPFKRQRGGAFRGNQNYNNPGRQNFRGRGSFHGGQNFNRGRGSYGGQSYNQGGRGGRGGGRGSYQGQGGGSYFPGGRFNRRGSFPRHRGGGGFKNPEASNVIEVTFPNIRGSYKDIFTEVLDSCNMILRPRPITSTCTLEEVKEKLSLLKEITIDGNKLNLTVSTSAIHPLKKTIQLPEKFTSEAENIKQFFGADSIEPVKSFKDDRYIPMHILTFASEKAAKIASTKGLNLNYNLTLGLKPYYNVETLYSDAEEKTNMENFEENAKAILEKLNAETMEGDKKEGEKAKVEDAEVENEEEDNKEEDDVNKEEDEDKEEDDEDKVEVDEDKEEDDEDKEEDDEDKEEDDEDKEEDDEDKEEDDKDKEKDDNEEQKVDDHNEEDKDK